MAVDATAASGSRLARDLRQAVAGLERLEARPSQLRLLGLASLLLLAGLGYWSRADPAAAILAALVAGLAYALLLISTHEMVHGTCLGRPRLEFVLGCLLSWPMAWPFASYASLHRLHHRWNGSDRRDPERVQPLPSEWRRASPLQRWCLRHPLPLRALLLGGIGLILETLGHGWRLRHHDRRLSDRLRLDLLAILTLHTLLLTFACHQGLLGRYLLFWLLLERVIGAIVQCRGLIEHHGLWRRRDSHLLTQLYGSRSVSSSGLLNVLMGACRTMPPTMPSPGFRRGSCPWPASGSRRCWHAMVCRPCPAPVVTGRPPPPCWPWLRRSRRGQRAHRARPPTPEPMRRHC